ncbi:hypothetical protein SMC26_08955 [Actinomadura fulvescens]|uniref:Uncharacterized protein n=1 Tax=Actinomadura fulvescens TaxID=46160 RepID=A0ABP6D7S9_9ACTN
MGKVADAPPWAATDVDPEVLLGELKRRFAGVMIWRGEFTGSWFAAPRLFGEVRLIESKFPAELACRLEELGARRRAVPGGSPDDAAARRAESALAAASTIVASPPRASACGRHVRRRRGLLRRLLDGWEV